MNNASTPARPAGHLPPLSTLIRPEMIASLQWFPEENKESYRDGVAKVWAKLESNPPDSAEYQNAYKRLVDVSMNIRNKMNKAKAEAATVAAAQQNGARPMSSGLPGQQDARPPIQGGGQPQGQDFSPKVYEEIRKLRIIAPPAISNQGQEKARAWIQDAQNKYAQHLHRLETSANQLRELQYQVSQRQALGKPFEPRETEQIRTRKERLEQNQRETREFLSRFQQQQESFRQHAQSQPGNGAESASNIPQAPSASTSNQESKSGMNGQSQKKTEAPHQPHTVSSAVNAARNQADQGTRSAISPQANNTPSQLPPKQPSTSRPQPNPSQIPTSHPPLNLNTNARPSDHQHNSPHVTTSQPTSLPQEPIALTHQAAMDQARASYSHPNIHQSTPQSATHGHPPDQRNQQNQAKMPIPKELNVPPPQPVSMGPSRPTLTNGPGPMGLMGQPAIHKHPGYVLEGEGERVLSKKKLEELVRQVTGGTGGEGEEGEALTAEVEEVNAANDGARPASQVPLLTSLQTLLEVADEFVDQVIVAACKLAKLRQSSTLDIRDLQVVLERNYNIRVPGYSSDELRTVRKIVPTQGWTQKLSAVQAAKVTGGKGDL